MPAPAALSTTATAPAAGYTSTDSTTAGRVYIYPPAYISVSDYSPLDNDVTTSDVTGSASSKCHYDVITESSAAQPLCDDDAGAR